MFEPVLRAPCTHPHSCSRRLAPFCRALLPKEQLHQGASPASSSPAAGILGAYEASRAHQPQQQPGKEEHVDAQALLDAAAELVQLQDAVAGLERRRSEAQHALQQVGLPSAQAEVVLLLVCQSGPGCGAQAFDQGQR